LIAHILFYFSRPGDLVLGPMSAQRFNAVVVSTMQKKSILGGTDSDIRLNLVFTYFILDFFYMRQITI
jgi:hypothetical protein